ncbi:ImmA/IrrE family metallo-endopeptidase [Qipengyuania aquimaris]|uniref:ImmA/IrrE family metallo-endopeptidase n=1 Tax=Qipengyuania aquimaris TaxID=255984 RepID=UPI001FD527E2|nr:ImmA/IrrE family metallo-endopeptidase [Qipengyuania aquimaris]UOR15092.1 ImmA/IrrE family metallo-endopeptidase [Qipengyuania aquimaris]
MNIRHLSSRSGVSQAKLTALIEGDDQLSTAETNALADSLAIPAHALFVSAKEELTPAIDFRSSVPSIGEQNPGTLKAIAFVEQISGVLHSIDEVPEIDEEIFSTRPAELTKKAATKLAKHWRKKWGISSEEQAEWKDANKVYTSLRAFIENLGIAVIHSSFGSSDSAGLYIETPHNLHAIVINTTLSSKARKVFTLAHEFGHVLLGKEGISNPSIAKNKIEKFCNWFAARMLAPKSLISYALERYHYTPSTDDDFIRLFSQKLGISQEATFLRLVETDYLDLADYKLWKARFRNQNYIPTGDLGTKGGGGAGDPIKNKLTKYGFTLVRRLASAKRRGEVDAIDIYRVSGLKPAFQDAVFEAA